MTQSEQDIIRMKYAIGLLAKWADLDPLYIDFIVQILEGEADHLIEEAVNEVNARNRLRISEVWK